MKYEALEKIQKLHKEGILTDDEFAREKEKVLNGHWSEKANLGMDTHTYCMLMHISQLLGLLMPLVGYIVPILMWIGGKDGNHEIDMQGRIVMNWIVSSLIYMTVFGILCFVLVGIPFFIAIGICSIVFPIIGAIKANDKERWSYPFSIQILKVS